MRPETAQALTRLHEKQHRLAAHVHPATCAGKVWEHAQARSAAATVCGACKRPPAVRLVVELDAGLCTLCIDCWRLWTQGAIEVSP